MITTEKSWWERESVPLIKNSDEIFGGESLKYI